MQKPEEVTSMCLGTMQITQPVPQTRAEEVTGNEKEKNGLQG